MSDNNQRPKVFPTQQEIDEANQISEKLNSQIFEKLKESGGYDALLQQVGDVEDSFPVSAGELAAAEEMRIQRERVIEERNKRIAEIQSIPDKAERSRLLAEGADIPYIHRPDLAEPSSYQAEIQYGSPKVDFEKPQPPKVNFESVKSKQTNSISEEDKWERLSQPQNNVPFDVIPLPSKGKLYANKKAVMKVGYLNASDENILTNPNLLESGKFLEILINRKMLDTNIRYKDLHVGDRNAIMIWLRATGYGPEYPISVYDPETGLPFETNIDLSQLKMIELEVDTDAKGYIDYILPLSKSEIKFRLLTVGDLDEIDANEEAIKNDPDLGPEFVDSVTYILKKQIMVVNGHTDREYIENFISQMRIGDVKAFRKYVNEIESGMDMSLTVGTPGGGSLKTFLPLNLSFFWPDL